MSAPCVTSPLLVPQRPRRILEFCWMSWYECCSYTETWRRPFASWMHSCNKQDCKVMMVTFPVMRRVVQGWASTLSARPVPDVPPLPASRSLLPCYSILVASLIKTTVSWYWTIYLPCPCSGGRRPSPLRHGGHPLSRFLLGG